MPLDGEQFSFLEKVINLVEKHGLVRIFKAICNNSFLFCYVQWSKCE